MRVQAQTIAIAAAGTALFWAAGLPLPFLFGPMGACLLAALAGARLRGLGAISVGARTILGVAVGASITPALMAQAPQMLASVALIPVYVAIIGVIGVPFFRRACGFDPVTAYYAAMPGGLQDMVAFGVAYVLILAALAAAFAEAVMLAGLAAPVEAFLAFAPGGQAEMTVLAIVAGADLGYVISHHLMRMVIVIAGAPVVARLLRLRRG